MIGLAPREIGFRVVLGIAASLATATARADLITSYAITIDAGAGDVSAIVIGETLTGGVQRVVFPFEAPEGATTEARAVLPIGSEPLGSVLLGVIEDETVFGGGHVVLMISDASAALVEGKSWESLFRYTREADVASSLLFMASDASLSDKYDSILFIQNFIKDVLGIGYYDPISQQLVPYQFQLGDSFSVLRFTDGERIGSGTSRLLGAVVPEPASGTLLATGAAAFGLVLWRRRRRHAA